MKTEKEIKERIIRLKNEQFVEENGFTWMNYKSQIEMLEWVLQNKKLTSSKS